MFNVTLGFVVFRERLRPQQWTAVGLAAAGVMVQLIQLGRLPWIALVLATSFSIYGVLRKGGPLGSMTGLTLETLLLLPAAGAFLAFRTANATGALGVVGTTEHVLILATGVVTAVPLLLFGMAARSLPLATVGLLQYLAPSVQFLLGVLVYAEPFGRTRASSFALIWVGLALYTADSLRAKRNPWAAHPPAGKSA